jgi:hypothetical protein
VGTGTASSLFGTASVQNFEFELKNEKFAKKTPKNTSSCDGCHAVKCLQNIHLFSIFCVNYKLNQKRK